MNLIECIILGDFQFAAKSTSFRPHNFRDYRRCGLRREYGIRR